MNKQKESKQSQMPEPLNLPISHQIYLLRHGEVDIDPGICYGQLDCSVTSSFTGDLQKLTDYFYCQCLSQLEGQQVLNLEHIEQPIIITSPLKRCTQLAKGLHSYFDKVPFSLKNRLQINADFQEINFGQWEGKPWQSIGQTQIEKWNRDLVNFTFPNGESALSFDQRVLKAWQLLQQQLAEQTRSQTLIIICHAGVIRSILSDFLHIPLAHSLSLQIDKMSVSRLTIVPEQPALSRCTGINRQL